MGVKVAEQYRQEMRAAGEEVYVTDHYGVLADFHLDEDGLRQNVFAVGGPTRDGFLAFYTIITIGIHEKLSPVSNNA